jgi:Protein of unknown function (DUF664)
MAGMPGSLGAGLPAVDTVTRVASGAVIYEHDGVSWTAPEVTRIDEPFTGPERGILDGFLDWHRATLLWKCAGLTGEQLALASAPPSNLSLLGIVRHMADVERAWFRRSLGIK